MSSVGGEAGDSRTRKLVQRLLKERAEMKRVVDGLRETIQRQNRQHRSEVQALRRELDERYDMDGNALNVGNEQATAVVRVAAEPMESNAERTEDNPLCRIECLRREMQINNLGTVISTATTALGKAAVTAGNAIVAGNATVAGNADVAEATKAAVVTACTVAKAEASAKTARAVAAKAAKVSGAVKTGVAKATKASANGTNDPTLPRTAAADSNQRQLEEKDEFNDKHVRISVFRPAQYFHYKFYWFLTKSCEFLNNNCLQIFFLPLILYYFILSMGIL